MSQYRPSLCYIQQSSDIQDSTMSVSKGKSDISPALYSIRSVIFESLYTCMCHIRTCIKQCSISHSYMLSFFRGELTERFLFWLREPPMAMAEALVVSELSQMLRVLRYPPEVHPRLSSKQPVSVSEHHTALPLMTGLLSI